MTENARVLSMEKRFDAAAESDARYDEFKSDKVMASAALTTSPFFTKTSATLTRRLRPTSVSLRSTRIRGCPEGGICNRFNQESQTEFEDAAKTFESMTQFKNKKKPTDTEKVANWEQLQKDMGDALQNAGLIREAQ